MFELAIKTISKNGKTITMTPGRKLLTNKCKSIKTRKDKIKCGSKHIVFWEKMGKVPLANKHTKKVAQPDAKQTLPKQCE